MLTIPASDDLKRCPTGRLRNPRPIRAYIMSTHEFIAVFATDNRTTTFNTYPRSAPASASVNSGRKRWNRIGFKVVEIHYVMPCQKRTGKAFSSRARIKSFPLRQILPKASAHNGLVPPIQDAALFTQVWKFRNSPSGWRLGIVSFIRHLTMP